MCIDEGGILPMPKEENRPNSQLWGDVFNEDFFNSIICNFVETAQTTINQFRVLKTNSIG
jgi:hypothetical protein